LRAAITGLAAAATTGARGSDVGAVGRGGGAGRGGATGAGSGVALGPSRHDCAVAGATGVGTAGAGAAGALDFGAGRGGMDPKCTMLPPVRAC
jgi:hypothetical protein